MSAEQERDQHPDQESGQFSGLVSLTKSNDARKSKVPDATWTRKELEDNIEYGDADIADWGRKTVRRQFEIGAAVHFLKPLLKQDGMAWTAWVESKGMNRETLNERERLFNAYQDRQTDLEPFTTMVGALEAAGVHDNRKKEKEPSKLSEEQKKQSLAETEARITEGAKKVRTKIKQRSEPVDDPDDEPLTITGASTEESEEEEVLSEDDIRKSLQGISAHLNEIEDEIPHLIFQRGEFVDDLRADLTLVQESLQSILDMLPSPPPSLPSEAA